MVEYSVRTGPVRVSGYALKLRRVINGVLSDKYKKGELSSETVNKSISEFNTKLFSIIVEKYKIPKNAIVNIDLSFDIDDGKVVVRDVNVEIFDKDEILSRNITEEIKNTL